MSNSPNSPLANRPRPNKLAQSPMISMGWLTLGVVSLLLSFIFYFLPVLTFVPFILLAAACFARGSPSLYRWLRAHPRFGPPLCNWEKSRSIPCNTRRLALAIIWTSIIFLFWLLREPIWLPWMLLVIAAAATAYLLQLPVREANRLD